VDQLADLVAVVVLMHYTNRMVAVFLNEVPLPSHVPGWMLDPVARRLGRIIGDADGRVRAAAPATASPTTPVPDLWWTASREALRDAFTGAATVIEQAGTRTVPAPVREMLDRELDGWSGQQRELDLSWAADACSSLPVADQATGRLVLLFAFAPYRVDRADLVATGAGDRELVEIGAWASLTTARRVGSRLARSSGHSSHHEARTRSTTRRAGRSTPGARPDVTIVS